jgi:thiaminase/transcriptional activator TenA
MNDASSYSERMRAQGRRTWNAILGHRFFREVATDAIDDRVFVWYLRIEYGFVDTAARVLGYAVAKAPSFQERRRLGLGLHGLVTDQEQFFINAFERMGVRAEERTALPPQGPAVALHALFLKVAETESYEEILACILAAEWMYLTWCSTADQSPSSRGYIRDWVALHAGGAFADHVAWVRSEIDTRGPTLAAARQARLSALSKRLWRRKSLSTTQPTLLETGRFRPRRQILRLTRPMRRGPTQRSKRNRKTALGHETNSLLQWNGTFGPDSDPSRAGRCRRAFRPNATSPAAIRNVRFSSTPVSLGSPAGAIAPLCCDDLQDSVPPSHKLKAPRSGQRGPTDRPPSVDEGRDHLRTSQRDSAAPRFPGFQASARQCPRR